MAKGGLACYQCDRATFNAVLGSLQELLDNETKRRDRMDAKKGVVVWTGLEVRPPPYIPLHPLTPPYTPSLAVQWTGLEARLLTHTHTPVYPLTSPLCMCTPLYPLTFP